MTADIDQRRRGYWFGCELVRLHDEAGFPLDLSLQMAAEQNLPVAFLGLVAEAAGRKWGKATLRPYVEQWAKLFRPSEAEAAALAAFRAHK